MVSHVDRVGKNMIEQELNENDVWKNALTKGSFIVIAYNFDRTFWLREKFR